MTMRWTATMRAIILAGAAAMMGVGSQAFADQIHTTVTLAAGASSSPITVPVMDSPVILTCTQTVRGNVATGQVTLTRSSTDGEYIWEGYDQTGNIKAGQSSVAPHIVYCDFGEFVDIQSASTTQIKIVNKSSAAQTVVVMMTY
jgi:hypothetical protein